MRNTKSDAAQRMFGRSRKFGANAMYFYTTRLVVFLAVTGGLAAVILLLLSGETNRARFRIVRGWQGSRVRAMRRAGLRPFYFLACSRTFPVLGLVR